jgi:hypothetical protein
MTRRSLLYRLEPAAPRPALIRVAGAAWALGGIILAARAAGWLAGPAGGPVPLVLTALAVGWLKSRWILAPLARRNIARIEALAPHKPKVCVFAFQAMQSYLLVLAMVGGGLLLRHTPLPRPWLGWLYLAVGSALILASGAYWRHRPSAAGSASPDMHHSG